MRTRSFRGILGFLAIGAITALAGTQRPAAGSSTVALYENLPLAFEEWSGPMEPMFAVRGPGYGIALSPKRVSLVLPAKGTSAGSERNIIAVDILGAAQNSRLVGLEQQPGKTNYFLGNDPRKWRADVRTFAKVKYENIYPNIDLVFYGAGRELEYDFVVRPGADPASIAMMLTAGTGRGAVVEDDGSLAIPAGDGTIRFRAPVLYQNIGKAVHPVKGAFTLHNQNDGKQLIGFAVAPYDHSRPLTIDPILDYSTYLGGSDDDTGIAVAVDDSGNAYVAGTTVSLDFPSTPNAVFPTHAPCSLYCADAFVAKLDTEGKGLEYATYLGGSQDDNSTAIAIDASGNAYVTGTTTSTDFPTTGNAMQRSCGGTCDATDAFVTKLNPDGSALLYSTYLGGTYAEYPTSIAVRGTNAYIGGFSQSSDFPVTPGVYQPNEQGLGSSFVVEFNPTGTGLVFGTFLGQVDLFYAGGYLTVDSTGNVYVTGATVSPNFPITTGAFRTPFLTGQFDNLYALKLNPTGTALIYSALIGGASPYGITTDAAGNSYMIASAGPFSPVTPGALDQACDTGMSVFKFNAAGSNLLTAARICPDNYSPAGIALDANQNIVMAAASIDPSVPTTVGALHTKKTSKCCFSQVVLGKLKNNGSAIEYLTYFGGSNGEQVGSLAQDSSGDIYLAGATYSTNLPVSRPYQAHNAGHADAFLSKFTLPATELSVSPASLAFSQQGIGFATSALPVAVANVSSAPIEVLSVAASGDFAISTNTCGSTLAAGAVCTLAITFKPTLASNRVGTLTVNASTGQQAVALQGKGVTSPWISFSTNNQINTAGLLTSPPFPVTVTNVGAEPLIVKQIYLDNGPAFNFTGGTNCFAPIPPLGTCTVNVTYAANGFASPYATLTFIDNAPSQLQNFSLVGNVAGSGMVLTPSSIRFGQQPSGTSSAAQPITLINDTGADVSIASIKTSASFLQTHTCGPKLVAGAYCTINVSFKPGSLGIKQGTLVVNSNAAGGPVSIPLIGTGD
jgi:hypothetical protein